jgi:DNA-binding IclR family transcriptional regulator
MYNEINLIMPPVSVNRVNAVLDDTMKSLDPLKQQGVEAAEVVGKILSGLLTINRPARLKDLENSTGLASAKLHRYLVSMIRTGLISKSVDGSRYDFGLLSYRLGQFANHDQDLWNLLQPFFEDFVDQLQGDELGQAVGIGRWVGTGATMIRWFERDAPLSIRANPGVQLGVTTSATAKLLAAHLPAEVTRDLVKRELSQRGQKSLAAEKAVFSEYQDIVACGMACSIGARRRGLNALSTPLFDHSGQVIAAITVLGMAPHFEADLQGRAAQLLKQLGHQLSAQLGYKA